MALESLRGLEIAASGEESMLSLSRAMMDLVPRQMKSHSGTTPLLMVKSAGLRGRARAKKHASIEKIHSGAEFVALMFDISGRAMADEALWRTIASVRYFSLFAGWNLARWRAAKERISRRTYSCWSP